MTPTEITTAARRAWAEDEEGVAQRETRTALDDDEPDTDPLTGWTTGFRCGVENDDGYPVETLWKGWSAGCRRLDGSAVHKRFLRGYEAGKAWRAQIDEQAATKGNTT